MHKQIIALFVLVAVASAQNLNGWRNCGSHMATVHAMRITNCAQTPCIFVRGQTYYIEVEATALVNSNTLRFAMMASAFGLPVELLRGDACDNLIVGTCPATSGNRFTFRLAYTVGNILPNMSTVVTSTVYNDFGDMGICIQVDVAITGAAADTPDTPDLKN